MLEAILHFSLQPDANGNRWSDFYTGGQSDVVGLVSRNGYAIWATNGAAGGSVTRTGHRSGARSVATTVPDGPTRWAAARAGSPHAAGEV